MLLCVMPDGFMLDVLALDILDEPALDTLGELALDILNEVAALDDTAEEDETVLEEPTLDEEWDEAEPVLFADDKLPFSTAVFVQPEKSATAHNNAADDIKTRRFLKHIFTALQSDNTIMTFAFPRLRRENVNNFENI